MQEVHGGQALVPTELLGLKLLSCCTTPAPALNSNHRIEVTSQAKSSVGGEVLSLPLPSDVVRLSYCGCHLKPPLNKPIIYGVEAIGLFPNGP